MSTDATHSPLDATIEVVTPENIAVHYRVAGPVRRALAFAIDMAIFCFIAALALFVLGQFGAAVSPGLAFGAGAVFMFAMYWFFFGAQEAFFGGRTLGKWILGLRVITIDGQPINALQAIMRALLRSPDFFVPIIDLVTMSLNERFQRLGDIVCGTVVVFEDRSWLFGVAKLDDPRAVQLAAYLPIDFEVTKSLAKALSTYVERRRFFSPPRRREVARHLAEPLLKKFALPQDTSYDLLLCALYYRAFIADRNEDEQQAAAIAANSNPFVAAASPAQPTAYGYGSVGAGSQPPEIMFPQASSRT